MPNILIAVSGLLMHPDHFRHLGVDHFVYHCRTPRSLYWAATCLAGDQRRGGLEH